MILRCSPAGLRTQLALSGFKYSDAYQLFPPERQHQSDIGISKQLLQYLATFIKTDMGLTNQAAQQLIDNIDATLAALPPYPNLHIPGGITSDKYTSVKRRNLMQVLPYALWGQSTHRKWQQIVETFVYYAEWELLRDSPRHTDDTLALMDAMWCLFSDKAQKVFAGYSASDFNTVKWHMSTHYSECIKLFGPIRLTESTAYEALHRFYAKLPYMLTNKQPGSLTDQVWCCGCW